MSTVKTNNAQIGQSATATNNFTWYQPASPDGTVRLGVGNSGATSSDVMTLNSSGNVGIGTSSPSEKLDVFGQGQFRPITNTTGNSDWFVIGSIQEASNFGVGVGLVVENSGSNAYGMTFGTRPAGSGITERMRIDSSGNTFIANPGTITFNAANTAAGFGVNSAGKTQVCRTDSVNTVFAVQSYQSAGTSYLQEYIKGTTSVGYMTATTSGLTLTGINGLTFTATQSASSDANTLDDYEEGTWTPALTNVTQGNGIYSGTYTKVGDLVTVMCIFNWGSTTSAGTVTGLTGLPFAVKSGTNFPSAVVTCSLLRQGVGWYTGSAVANAGTTAILQISISGGGSVLSGTNPVTWQNTDAWSFSMTYKTST